MSFPGLLSVVIPAYNEEGAVGQVVRRVVQVLRREKVRHEVIVVDDGSRDATAARAAQAGARVVRMGENRGYGASLKAGIRQAKGDWIAILDADGTYPPEELPRLLKEAPANDMVVGARTRPGAAIPALRRLPKWFLGQWANYLAERRIPDLNSGLRVFKKSAMARYEGLFPNGFSFTTTITLALECHGYIVRYLPIRYLPRVGESKIRPFRDTVNFFALVLRVVMYFKPLKIFIPLSGIIFLASLASALRAHGLGQGLTAPTLLLFVAGLQIAAL
ncbi:MAG TPA: glycosyltransferase family 2 protein, partial [bacterium]|nr:glycosyltransferase family 2 protein [bacterium]